METITPHHFVGFGGVLFAIGFQGLFSEPSLGFDVPGVDAEWRKRRSSCLFPNQSEFDGSCSYFS